MRRFVSPHLTSPVASRGPLIGCCLDQQRHAMHRTPRYYTPHRRSAASMAAASHTLYSKRPPCVRCASPPPVGHPPSQKEKKEKKKKTPDVVSAALRNCVWFEYRSTDTIQSSAATNVFMRKDGHASPPKRSSHKLNYANTFKKTTQICDATRR